MTLLDDLKAVRELLSEPERWTQGTMARNAKGRCVRQSSDAARCWCLSGALGRVCWDRGTHPKPVLAALREVTGGLNVVTWNDAPNRTHAEVLALLDAAIEAEGKMEGAAK